MGASRLDDRPIALRSPPLSTPESSTPKLLTAPFVRLIAGHFLQALGFSSMLTLPLYLGHLGASRTEIGMIMAVASIGGLALRPLAGWALDSIGRRPVVIAGTLVLALGMAMVGFVDRVGPLIYVSRILVGVGAGTLFTAYFTFAADLIPVIRRTEGIALFGISGVLPLAVNGLIERIDLPVDQLRWVFPAIAVLILASLWPVWGLAEPPREGHDGAQSPAVGPPDGVPPVRRPVRRPAWRTLSARPLWPVWGATVIFSGLVAVFMAFATVVAARGGAAEPADLWFAYGGGAVTVRLVGARLPDRIGPHNMVTPALGAYAVACLLAASATTDAGFVTAGLLAGIGHGYCFPVLTGQVVDRSPAAARGVALAAFTALWEISALALTPLFGAVADAYDDATMFALAAVAAIVGSAIWVIGEHVSAPVVARPRRDGPPPAG